MDNSSEVLQDSEVIYAYVRNKYEDLVYNETTGQYEYAHSEESGDESGSEESGESGQPIPPQSEEISSITIGKNPIINFVVGNLQVKQVIVGNILVWEYQEPEPPVPPVPPVSNPTLTITPEPISANVQLVCGSETISGTGVQTISVESGSTVLVSVSASGYDSKNNIPVEVYNDVEMTVSLDPTMATVTFTTNAPNPTIVLESTGYTQFGNSITVPIGARVDYTISAEDYVTRSNVIYADEDKTYNIPLALHGEFAFTIAPRPSSTVVSFSATGYEPISGEGIQSIEVANGTNVSYSVSYNGVTLSSNIIITNDVLFEIDMTKQHAYYTLTFKNQSDSSEIVAGTMQIKSSEGTYSVGPITFNGTTIFVPKNELLTFNAHSNDFKLTYADSTTLTMDKSSTYNTRANTILTLNYTPTNANVVVKDCQGYVIPPRTESAGQNTYYMPWYDGKNGLTNTAHITGSAEGYQTTSIVATRSAYNSNVTATLNLPAEN